MATEASAVLVAVRVRPFNAKEDPLSCTITIPDSATINVTDVSAVLNSVASGNTSAGGSSTGTGGGGSGAVVGLTGEPAFGDSTAAPAKHSFAFDKVFWSVPPDVLPLHAPYLAEALSGGGGGGGSVTHSSVPPSRKESVLSTISRAGSVGSLSGLTPSSSASLPSTSPPLSQLAVSVAQHLPCLMRVPEYDDQASVYQFIGPKLYEAVMSGFNACLFAYGQTGSGKSYSMIGEHLSSAASLIKKGTIPNTHQGRELGIMPRLSADLFSLMGQEREKDESVSYTVEVSFLEIYCEKVRDLLAGVAGSSNSNNSNDVSGAATGGTASLSSTMNAATGISATMTSSTSTSYVNAASTSGSLRVRQHPNRGPYVEGLSHIRVRDAEGVVKHLVSGLRDRATAGTKMNEHSSRSHAILQLHITKVTVVPDDVGVMTKTRTCKVNLVDLAGSERVTQSGVTGDRFEEAKNINQSLSTLGRVIQQLSDKQAGKRVIPAYRDSVLTWLLSDSLGGNSKTIMLATVAPSAYCYGQTLNTLRFAGVAKKIINVATVNEDRQYQQIIAELRQQIVRLTLQLESGKAAEVHSAEIEALKAAREDLLVENSRLRSREAGGADPQTVLALRKRISELEDANAQLCLEKAGLQQKLLATSSSLREELAASRAEVLQLHNALSKKEAESADWQARYHAAQRPNIGMVSASMIAGAGGATAAASAEKGANEGPAESSAARRAQEASNQNCLATVIETSLSGQSTFISGDAAGAQKQLQDEIAKLKKQLQALKGDLKVATRTSEESRDSARTAQQELSEYRSRYESCQRQLDVMQERLEGTTALLESTQLELARAQQSVEPVASNAQRSAEEAVALATQLAQTRQEYLAEKQGNVQLLLRLSQLEQERGQFKKQAAERRRDINELEQLLLEETETSERYYLRMRFHRTLSEVQNYFTSKLLFAAERSGAAAAVGSMNSRRPSLILSGTPSPSSRHHSESFSPCTTTPRTLAGGEGQHSLAHSPSLAEQLLSQSAAATMNSLELMFAQLEYECMSDEAHQRAAIEQEALSGTNRLLGQKLRLRQADITHLDELLVETREQLGMASEQLTFFRAKATELERRVAELEERQLDSAEAIRESETSRQHLQRQLESAEDKLAEVEGNTDSLIEKLADAQAARDTMKQRCTELEVMLNEAQDTMLQWQQTTSPSATGTSTQASRGESILGGDDDKDSYADPQSALQQEQPGARQHRSHSVFDVKVAYQLKEKELHAALQEVQRLEAQFETYRGELGAVNALREKEQGEHQAKQAQLQQQVNVLNGKLQQLQESNAALEKEVAATVRDYEHRVGQQQAMITALRQSVEEESHTADRSRTSAQQAEANLHRLEQDLNAAQEANDELRRQHQLAEGRYAVVQKELERLREHYAALESQLMELRKKEPELYVLLERGLSEDTATWLDKVKREKASLLKQKQDARQLNSELLAHIRTRNSHLRDVQRQLTEIAESSVNASTAGVDVGASGGRARRGLDSALGDVTNTPTDSSLPSSIHSTPGHSRS